FPYTTLFRSLVKTNEIVYSPSASVIAAIRGGNPTVREGAKGAMLVIADPVFSADDPRAKGATGATASAETRGLGLALESAVNDVASPEASTTASVGFHLARLSGTRTEADEIDRKSVV